MKLEELTLPEVEQLRPLHALLPVGALEGHAQHLPYGTDNYIASELAQRVAARVDRAVVLPTVPYGMSWHYREYPMTLSLSPETLAQVLVDIMESVIDHGVRSIVILNGHDGNVASIEIACRRIEKEHGVVVGALEEWWVAVMDAIPADTFPPDTLGHAGQGETAMLMTTREDLVRLGRARAPEREPDHRSYVGKADVRKFAPMRHFYPTGEYPDARAATREQGEMTMDAAVDKVVAFMDRETGRQSAGDR
jgi:creatinine amidohydrolase